jgi:hypothetical protein
MACSDYDKLYEPLTDFEHVSDAVICPFVSDAGAGMGLPLFGMFVFSMIGLGMTIRTQHPAPTTVGGILSAGTAAVALPGLAAKVFAIVLFAGISTIGIYTYSRARTTF